MRESHNMTTTIDAEKMHRQHVDEAIREARMRADMLDRMYTEYSDKFMRDSCANKADVLRTLCNEIERLRLLIGGGRNV